MELCLLMAQMRSADRVRRLLFGVDRTYRGHRESDASDPKRTSVRTRSPPRSDQLRHDLGHDLYLAANTLRCLMVGSSMRPPVSANCGKAHEIRIVDDNIIHEVTPYEVPIYTPDTACASGWGAVRRMRRGGQFAFAMADRLC
jgi:hypothetical protein